jgi:cupin fold WbuC family metalloprotein
MDIQIINEELLNYLHTEAKSSERLRMNFDMRTCSEDSSQRMLNFLEVGTVVPIHRHEDTSESVICLKGRLDFVLFEELPNMDAGRPEREFKEIYRIELNPHEERYGIQIPKGVWHTVDVHEESCIFEAKDGAYKG